jgi:hypothetical protein
LRTLAFTAVVAVIIPVAIPIAITITVTIASAVGTGQLELPSFSGAKGQRMDANR